MEKELNIENMKKAVDFLKTNRSRIEKNFDMRVYRTEALKVDPVCKTTGCLCGWLSELDAKNILDNYIALDGEIDWVSWSFKWFGIDGFNGGVWDFLFGGQWSDYDWTNTLDQGIGRIEYMIKHKEVPGGWDYGDTYKDGDCYTHRRVIK